ncbi:type IV secretion system DNA-binding domain-containing protein [Novosphingobium sp. CECT 9465]|uniref:type IV secretion system DNA-binding domain-containing protein n=1 Tax=Novosphingobium sp. CECT 9465 TaxID=2829794 RepID=UPI001E5C4BD0|nr:type IV secretion system DNA-binding domain-containing protein [Novosphingobium sp. CECT 9465]CAH0496007.1 hypothetical protein NVSP9465_01032 [Novosphingobium sp. CECT 9465]
MKRNLGNFTRGSQLIEHFSFMFAAGLKAPLIVGLVVMAWTTWDVLSRGLSDHEVYLCWMRVYLAGYRFMEFDPAKDVVLRLSWGGSMTLPIAMLDNFPPIVRAWSHMTGLAVHALMVSGLLLVPLFVLWYWLASLYGKVAKQRKHERGSKIATMRELVRQVRDFNRQEQRKEWRAALGWRWIFCSRTELAKAFPYKPSSIAGIPYPWRLEQSHAMLIGTTGMGKTVALSDMVAQARARRQRAVIFDLTGHFIEHFYDPKSDVILNPLDARCPQWSVFDECRDEAEFTAAAEALVPHDGGGSEQFWVLAARLLFVEMCLKLRARGAASNEALSRQLMTADLSEVHNLMRGTIADPLTAPEAARMAESIRAVFNANAKALKLLPREGPRFSVRKWIEEDTGDGGIVFISARYVDLSVCSQLLTVWLDTAMNSLMTLERTRDVRIWFFLDELGALHRLPALEKGLQTARNFGGAIVTGIHAYAKLKEVYGENIAMTLSSLARTKLILGTADPDTSKWCATFIGEHEVYDMEEGYTYGFNNARDAVSLSARKSTEMLVMPSELGDLRRLTGYLKFPDGFPAGAIVLKPVDRRKCAQGFIRRPLDSQPTGKEDADGSAGQQDGSDRVQGGDNRPSANDDGAGRRVTPKQGELALGSPVEGQREPKTDQPGLVATDLTAASGDPPQTGPKSPIGRDSVASTRPESTGAGATDQDASRGVHVGRSGRTSGQGEGAEPDRIGEGASDQVAPQSRSSASLPLADPRRVALEGVPEIEPDARDLGQFDIEI